MTRPRRTRLNSFSPWIGSSCSTWLLGGFEVWWFPKAAGSGGFTMENPSRNGWWLGGMTMENYGNLHQCSILIFQKSALKVDLSARWGWPEQWSWHILLHQFAMLMWMSWTWHVFPKSPERSFPRCVSQHRSQSPMASAFKQVSHHWCPGFTIFTYFHSKRMSYDFQLWMPIWPSPAHPGTSIMSINFPMFSASRAWNQWAFNHH